MSEPLTHTLNNSSYQMVVSEIACQKKAYIIITKAQDMGDVAVVLRAAVPELAALGAEHIYVASKRPAVVLPAGEFVVEEMKFVYDGELRRMLLPSMRTAWPERIPGVLLLPLTPTLAQQYLELYNRNFSEVPNAAFYSLDDIQRMLHDPSYEGGLISIGGKIAGVYELSYREEVPEIASIALDPDFRGKGFGKQALRVLLYKLEQKGFDKAHLLVSSKNQAAIAAYESLGFEIGNTVSTWYRFDV